MIADEGLRHEAVEHRIVPLQRPGEFEHARGTEIDGIIKPGDEMAETMRDTGAGRGLTFGSDEAKRINVPPDTSLGRHPHDVSRDEASG